MHLGTDETARQARFERLWEPHRPRLWRLVVRLAGDPDHGDDLLQEVSLRAFQNFGGFRGQAGAYTWLYRIAVNVVLRWRERRPHDTLPLDAPEASALRAGSASDPQASALRSDLRPAVWAALDRLPEDQRATLILQLYEGLKYREIAAVLPLKDLLDGELSPWQTWRVRRHIARCPDCAKEWKEMQHLNTVLLSADPFAAARPVLNTQRHLVRRPNVRLRLAAGALATLLLAATLLFGPTWDRQPSSRVAAAIAQANTWHLSGWKQIGGRRVPWDIWGRRRPFLFCEKVGDNITFDDGARRLRIFPPAPSLHRPAGLVIRSATGWTPTLAGLLEPSAEGMVGAWNWEQGGGMFAQKPFRETATSATFRRQSSAMLPGVNTNLIFTISKRTWRPEQYRLHYQSKTAQWDTESLAAAYDVPLPPSIVSPAMPRDYTTIDLTRPASTGLSVQAKLVALDGGGNMIVRYRARLGGVALTPRSTFSLYADSRNHDGELYGVRDGGLVRYLHTTQIGMGQPLDDGSVYDLYSPLEPATPPQRLRVTLDVSPNVQVQGTDVQPEGQPYAPATTSQPLFTEPVTLTVALPPAPNAVSVADAMPKGLEWVFRRAPLGVQVCQARAGYYETSTDYQNTVFQRVAPDLIRQGALNADGSLNLRMPINALRLGLIYKRHEREFQEAHQRQQQQGIVWQKRLIAAWPSTGLSHWMSLYDTLTLAYDYRESDGQTQMRQTLRQLIAECQTLPQQGGLLRRQAEYALRTDRFPADAGYQGPS